MIDASNKRLVAWLKDLPPRQELVVRMALNGRAKNRGREWERRVDAPMKECRIDSTAKMARPLTDGRKEAEVIEAWAVGDE
jgi:hypothetical protein